MTPFLVVASFVAPILIAYWFAVMHPEHAPTQLLNRGTLLQPPIALDEGPTRAGFATLNLQPDEWGLLYFGAGPCGQQCASRLELAATIRSLIGAQGKRVHLMALLDGPPAAVPALTRVITDASARAYLAHELAKRLGAPQTAGFLFLDARHLAMMSFAPDAPPGDVKDDLKRLLRGSAVH